MVLNLREIVELPGGKISFSCKPDIDGVIGGSIAQIKQPATAKGSVTNKAGILSFNCEIEATYLCVCARCLKEFDYPVSKTISVDITQHGDGENPDGYYLTGDSIDATEIIVSELILNTDNILYCREDCAGLCQMCGTDLNSKKCECSKIIDPRLAILEQLLDK